MAMSQQSEIPGEEDDTQSSRFMLRLVIAGFAMMALAAGLMWWRFGPSMFMNLITAAANCF